MRYLYLVPASFLLLAVLAIPLLTTVRQSFGHYSAVLHDGQFRLTVENTLVFTGVSVGVEIVLGLLFAILLHRTFRLRGPVRAVTLIPWALPTAVMAMSWKWIFDTDFGVVNDLLLRAGLVDRNVVWLGKSTPAMTALIVADVWKTTPFVMIILLAGLQSIPRDLYEAMSIDGAGPVRRFFWVTLPMLRPAIALALVFRLIHSMGIFDLPRVLTNGQPGDKTKTVAMHVFDHSITFGEPGKAAAMTVLMAVGMFALAGIAGALVRGKART